MVTPENVLSVGGRNALRDMVELQMYLLAQPKEMSWSLFPRRVKKTLEVKRPYDTLVESRVARDLLARGLIEGTSNRTFIVSRSGYQYHERQPERNQPE